MLPGLLLVAAIGFVAMAIGRSPSLTSHGIGTLAISILLGAVFGNTLLHRLPPTFLDGIDYSRTFVLRAGIVLYGFRLSLHQLQQVGTAGVLIALLTIVFSFVVCYFVGTRVLKMPANVAILIGTGSSICGAAAILATDRMLKSTSEQVSISVATVTLFGTVATIIYPYLYQLSFLWHPTTDLSFGIYVGSTVHEIAQVVAAAGSVSPAASNIAVLEKMIRVMMLGPFLLVLGLLLRRADNTRVAGTAPAFPWFVIAFSAVVVLNDQLDVPKTLTTYVQMVDDLMLCMAMVALGLTTQWRSIRRAGNKPLLLGAIALAWLIAGGAVINHTVFLVENRFGS